MINTQQYVPSSPPRGRSSRQFAQTLNSPHNAKHSIRGMIPALRRLSLASTLSACYGPENRPAGDFINEA
ncbi:hypothetical protein [Streptomyces sp. NPDC048637]|uniref:hypothetical protein n=1 Tax=Streptomyces sp. NPDC048637 TaxID=3155636 RepID=UPI00343AE869